MDRIQKMPDPSSCTYMIPQYKGVRNNRHMVCIMVDPCQGLREPRKFGIDDVGKMFTVPDFPHFRAYSRCSTSEFNGVSNDHDTVYVVSSVIREHEASTLSTQLIKHFFTFVICGLGENENERDYILLSASVGVPDMEKDCLCFL